MSANGIPCPIRNTPAIKSCVPFAWESEFTCVMSVLTTYVVSKNVTVVVNDQN